MSWPVAMEAHGRIIYCDRCHEPAAILFREWGVFDLNRMFCESCMRSLGVTEMPEATA
jgi:hypothetical protein